MKDPNNNKFVIYQYSPIKCFIELDNSICASSIDYSNNLMLYDLNKLNKQILSFRAHINNVKWIIKSKNNNLISCGEDGLIKVWPLINEKFFQNSINEIKKKKESKNYKLSHLESINLNPLYEYTNKDIEIKEIEKMLYLKENSFVAISKKYIFLFKHLIENNEIKIELIQNYQINNLIDIYCVEKNNTKIIATHTQNCLFFFNISNLKIINQVNMKNINKNSLFQLNSNELLIVDNNFYFKIFDINNFKIKLTIKKYYFSDCILNMNDGTIIEGCLNGIKRFLIRTMQRLPDLVEFEDDEISDYYEYDYYTEKINLMYKLKDGRLVLCHQNGKIEIFNLNFI